MRNIKDMLTQITPSVFVLNLPFEELTTTVYIVKTYDGCAIIDSGTYTSDVDNYIIPALAKLDIAIYEVKYLLLTHSHADHSGGIKRLSALIPHALVGAVRAVASDKYFPLKDGDVLLDRIVVVSLKGHSEDSVGFLVTDSRTLLSGDCLQLAGVGKYVHGISDADKYIASIEKLKTMDIKNIVASHEYVPLGSTAKGKAQVDKYLETCIQIVLSKLQGDQSCGF